MTVIGATSPFAQASLNDRLPAERRSIYERLIEEGHRLNALPCASEHDDHSG